MKDMKNMMITDEALEEVLGGEIVRVQNAECGYANVRHEPGLSGTVNPAQQAQREADRVKARLAKLGFDVTVVPVVCFASDSFAGDTRELGSAKIVNANALVGWVQSQPEILAASDLARLVQLMNG